MLFGLRGPELLIILIVVLVIFGPKNLPKLGRMAGDAIHKTRELSDGLYEDDDDEVKTEEG